MAVALKTAVELSKKCMLYSPLPRSAHTAWCGAELGAGCQQCVEPGVAGSLVAGLVARVRRARCWGHVHSVCLVWLHRLFWS